VQLARSHWERLGAPRHPEAEAALTSHWKDWERTQKAVVVVDEEGAVADGLCYDSGCGLLICRG
jgi:hypothetical protein